MTFSCWMYCESWKRRSCMVVVNYKPKKYYSESYFSQMNLSLCFIFPYPNGASQLYRFLFLMNTHGAAILKSTQSHIILAKVVWCCAPGMHWVLLIHSARAGRLRVTSLWPVMLGPRTRRPRNGAMMSARPAPGMLSAVPVSLAKKQRFWQQPLVLLLWCHLVLFWSCWCHGEGWESAFSRMLKSSDPLWRVDFAIEVKRMISHHMSLTEIQSMLMP